MLNGLKGMFDPNRNKNSDDPKAVKRVIFIIMAIVVLAAVHFLYSFLCGDAEERREILDYIRSNFHINIIDVILCVTAFIIYLIIKTKNKKE